MRWDDASLVARPVTVAPSSSSRWTCQGQLNDLRASDISKTATQLRHCTYHVPTIVTSSSVCCHHSFWTNWHSTFIFCTCVGHDHSSPGIESQGHRSRSKVTCRVGVGVNKDGNVRGRSDLDHRSRAVCFLDVQRRGLYNKKGGLCTCWKQL